MDVDAKQNVSFYISSSNHKIPSQRCAGVVQDTT